MGLNTTTLKPALLKAKTVATEEYVDTSVSSIDIAGQLPEVIDSNVAPSGTDIYPKGTTWRQAKTINGGTEYSLFLSKGSGVWVAAGGTYIDGSKIVTGTLSAISADLGSITSGSLNINDKFIVESDGSTTLSIYDDNNTLRVKIGAL